MSSGFINVLKPYGLTSHDVVAKIRKLTGMKRVGHGGTLDPAAEGVLPVALGQACRLIGYLPSDKVYRARVELGITTDTDDLEGRIVRRGDTDHLKKEEVRNALLRFQGTIKQVPPQYSAIKVKGRKLYEMARKGESTTVEPRTVTIHSIELIDVNLPLVDIRVSCSKGTYIRSIARDLGEMLQSGGTLHSLIREEAGVMKIDDSVELEALSEAARNGRLCDHILKPWEALAMHPLEIDSDAAVRLKNGQRLPVCHVAALSGAIGGEAGGAIGGERKPLFLVKDGLPVALCRIEEGVLKPEVVFSDADGTI